MARIPEEVIERIKREVSVLRLAEAMGRTFKRNGADNYMCLCPFHSEKTASMVVSVKKNVYHCLGCGAKGDPINWVMQTRGVTFRHAVEILLADLPALEATSPARPVKSTTVRILPPPIERDADDHEVLGQVVTFYREQLKSSPDALAYLAKRGLDSPELIDRFQLGFANRTLGYRLPEKNRKSGAELRGRLTELGVYRASGHEHFNGSLVVPVIDESGNVVQIYGRKVRDDLRAGTPPHLYLPGSHRGVFNAEALRTSPEIILCEALLDALTFWRHGFRNVTSSYGVNGFTDEHLEAFKRHGTERVLIAYDRDDAGDQAAAALAEKLQAAGIACFRVEFPRCMDANEYALKVTPASKSLAIVLRKASWLGNGRKPELSLARARVLDLDLSLAAKEEALKPTPIPESPPNLPPDAEVPEAKTTPATAAEASPPPPIASPLPPPQRPPDAVIEVQVDEVLVHLGDRHYRVRGLPAGVRFEKLEVNLFVSRDGLFLGESSLEAGYFVDTLNLYKDTQRERFAKQAAQELRVEHGVIRKDLGRLLLKLEELQEQRKKAEQDPVETKPTMSEEDERQALELLRDPRLCDRILEDFERCGVVGEETNKLMGYLAAVSRKLATPLAVIIQSSSAAGKSSLMDGVLAFVPEEDRVKYSAMTGQALFYEGRTKLKHKILAIVEEEGAERAIYAMKLLLSEGELTMASTGKDPKTGRLETEIYHVEGPVTILLTTTAAEIEEELKNRCLVLTVDEEREQTAAIHRLQRKRRTLAGVLARRERTRILKLHRNAQRLLRPLDVVNPYADELTFLDDQTRTRRDQPKYLTLIEVVALLHQHQREVKIVEDGGEKFEIIEATLDDIAMANRLTHAVLGRSLDELAPQTRRLLLKLEAMVSESCTRLKVARTAYRFSRKDVRQRTGWSAEQLQIHMNRLVDLEYLLVHRGGRGQSFVYELAYDGKGQDGARFALGLVDVEVLRRGAGRTEESEGQKPEFLGPSEAHLRPILGPSEAPSIAPKPKTVHPLVAASPRIAENAHLDPASLVASYPQDRRLHQRAE